MSQETNNTKNIFSLQDFKLKKLSLKNDTSIKKYLEVLSMEELITESQSLIKTINKGMVDKEVILLSKQLLKEFTNRLNAENDGFTSILKQWGKKFASLPTKK